MTEIKNNNKNSMQTITQKRNKNPRVNFEI